ncbi:hypothetical protein EOM89_13680 [Candidatus Falkowbacteria bacterium]|nr:hypothetical protein [Candidatus Falkowbacteria bacterium]
MAATVWPLRFINWRKLRQLILHRPSGGYLDPPGDKLGPLDLAQLPAVQVLRNLGKVRKIMLRIG